MYINFYIYGGKYVISIQILSAEGKGYTLGGRLCGVDNSSIIFVRVAGLGTRDNGRDKVVICSAKKQLPSVYSYVVANSF